jgi:hypothetical protein
MDGWMDIMCVTCLFINAVVYFRIFLFSVSIYLIISRIDVACRHVLRFTGEDVAAKALYDQLLPVIFPNAPPGANLADEFGALAVKLKVSAKYSYIIILLFTLHACKHLILASIN